MSPVMRTVVFWTLLFLNSTASASPSRIESYQCFADGAPIHCTLNSENKTLTFQNPADNVRIEFRLSETKSPTTLYFLLGPHHSVSKILGTTRTQDQILNQEQGGPLARAENSNFITSSPLFSIPPSATPITFEAQLTGHRIHEVIVEAKASHEINKQAFLTQFWFAFLIGSVFLMLVYQTIISMGLGIQKVSLAYVLFVMGVTTALMSAYGFLDYLLPTSINFHAAQFDHVFSFLSLFASIGFILHLMNPEGNYRKYFLASATGSIVGLGLFLGIKFILNEPLVANSVANAVEGLLVTGNITGLSILAFRGSPKARLMLIAWLPLSAYVIVEKLTGSWSNELWGRQLVIIPVLLEIYVMSYAFLTYAVELRKTGEQGQQSLLYNKSLKQILRSVSHDLNNHFFVIDGRLKTELRRQGDEKSIANINKALGALDRSISVVKALRDWILSSEGRLNLKLESTALKPCIVECMDTFEDKLAAKEIKINMAWSEELKNPMVMVDRIALVNQVLNNLVSNAIKFSTRGSSIQIRILKNEKNLVLEIQDHGQGMPQDKVLSFFKGQMVESSLGTEEEKGTGFGMSLMRSYLAIFNVRIEIISSTEPSSHGTLIRLVWNQFVEETLEETLDSSSMSARSA